MNQSLRMMAFVLSLFIVTSVGAQTYWDGSADTGWAGDGTPESPYLISSAAQLAGLAEQTNHGNTFEGKYFRLTADLWLSDPAVADDAKPMWAPIGRKDLNNGDVEENPGGFYGTEYWFKGNFDGDGHTIHNLWYAHDSKFMEDLDDPFGDGTLDFEGWYKGLFGSVDGATITNLNVSGVSIQCTAEAAGVAVHAKNSKFSDITVDGTIWCGTKEDEGGRAGGLVYEAEDCSFVRCHSDATVRSVSCAGGLVGSITNSTVDDCSSSGRVISMKGIGGLIGYIQSGSTVTKSHSSASIKQLPAKRQGGDCGGFAGENFGGVISCCYATGNIEASNAAGFISTNRDNGLIESCYATGNIVYDSYGVWMATFINNNGGVDVGGIVETKPGRIINCFGAGSYTYQPAPADVITTGNHLGGFFTAHYEGGVAANCFYNADKVGDDVNNWSYDGVDYPWPNEFGLTTEYMQSQAFVDELNHMAAVAHTSTWQYNPGTYPTPTGIVAESSMAGFSGGSGTDADPFRIASKTDLERFASMVNHGWDFHGQSLLQTADIALNAPQENWGEQMPQSWTPIAYFPYFNNSSQTPFYFRGVYDGGLHTVANMYIGKDAAMDYAGLFGIIGDDAVIRNLGVTDAWVEGKTDGNHCAILLGAAKLHNDIYEGPRSVTGCWTSGYVSGPSASPIVGFMGLVNEFRMEACYSTATFQGGTYMFEGTDISQIYGCWYGGADHTAPMKWGADYFWTFYDSTKNDVHPNNEYSIYGRTTEYMQSPRFVNDLNYAAAAKGIDVMWGYNEGQYPSFFGEKPTLTVILVDGVGSDITFKAFSGSTLSRPSAPARDGYQISGWYTDPEFNNLFKFGETPVNADIKLYARWIKSGVVPDYAIFKNPFSTTYNITTPEQWMAFANIVNGTTDGAADQSDFTGKTVKLGADIALNDVSDYDIWGTADCLPVLSPVIGTSSTGTVFNGTFLGQGHVIDGLYVDGGRTFEEQRLTLSGGGLFGYIGKDAKVSDLIIRHACIVAGSYLNTTLGNIGILAAQNYGSITRCGVEGKIITTRSESRYVAIGGLVGNAESSSDISECYAHVSIQTDETACGGLVGINAGSLANSYVKGSVTYSKYGSYGGITSGAPAFANCYAAVDVKFGVNPTYQDSRYIGGAYGSETSVNRGEYDRDLVAAAFDNVEPVPSNVGWSYKYPYDKGIGLSTVKMKMMKSFDGYDFTGVWGRRDDRNGGYPYLRWTAPGLDNDTDPVIFEPVTSVTLDRTEASGKPGETVQLTATVLPEDATNTELKWTSSDESVATVDANGLVTFVADGEAIVTASTVDGSGVSASCTIKVTTPVVLVTRITLDKNYYRGNGGETVQLTATVFPDDATNPVVEWTSSDESIATVDATGLVTLVARGSAKIKASATDGSGVYGECDIRVSRDATVLISAIEFDRTDITGIVGAEELITVTVLPDNATNPELKWTSSDESVAVVVGGEGSIARVILIAEGEAEITATTTDGSDLSATCRVTVTSGSGIDTIGINGNEHVEVFNLSGYKLYSGTYIDMHLAPGIYIVRRADGTCAKEVVK